MTIRIDGTNTAANPGITGTDTDTGLQFGTDEVNIVTGGFIRTKVDSSGRVLIGQNDTTGVDAEADDLIVSSTAHTGITVRSGSSHNASVYFADQDAVRQGRIEYNHTSDYMRFNTGGTERLRITSDGTLQLNNSPGIDFSQIQTNATGMTSETLDSYEEGTFTPTLGGSSTAGTTANGAGRYVKIGKLVHFQVRFSNVQISGGSGAAMVSNMPFNIDASNSDHPTFSSMHWNVSFDSSRTQIWFGGNNTGKIYAYENRNGASWTDWAYTNWDNASIYLGFSGTYYTTA